MLDIRNFSQEQLSNQGVPHRSHPPHRDLTLPLQEGFEIQQNALQDSISLNKPADKRIIQSQKKTDNRVFLPKKSPRNPLP